MLLLSLPAHAGWVLSTVALGAHHPTVAIRDVILPDKTKAEITFVAYRQDGPQFQKSVVVAYPSGGAWIAETIESVYNTDEISIPKIAIDAQGMPHVTYFESFTDAPYRYRYAHRVAEGTGNCGNARWRCLDLPLPSTGYANYDSFIATGSDGTVHFIYGWFYPNAHLIYARVNSNGTWSATGLPFGEAPASLTVDSANSPHLAWLSSNNTGGPAGWEFHTSTGWGAESFGSAQFIAADLKLYADSPKACYTTVLNSPDYPSDSRAVGLAERSSSGQWILTAVGIARRHADVSEGCTLSLGSTGLPSIAYIADSSPYLRVASCNSNGLWVAENVASTIVHTPSIANRAGNKRTIAFDTTCGSQNCVILAAEQ